MINISDAHDRLIPSPRLYMAPLRGYTDQIFRNTFSEHFGGFDLAVAPFIVSTNGNKIRRKYLKCLLPENNTGMPVIPQILSRSARGFIPLANYLFDLGYEAVNWNLGCPHPLVAGKMRGSGLLPHTDRIRIFLEEVIPAIRGRVSIKTRLGWNSKDDIFKLISVLNRFPIEEIIIHPRTGTQMYEGRPDLDAFARCLKMTHHPIVYNGDIRSADDFMAFSERFNDIGRWMIGRWSLVNPFLPTIIKSGKDSIKDKTVKLKLFHDALFEQYSSVSGRSSKSINRMKGLWRYFSMAFRDRSTIMEKIKKTGNSARYLDVVNHFFDEEARWVGPHVGEQRHFTTRSTSPSFYI